MDSPGWLVFGERRFPSGNVVLARGPRPWLIDSGFGAEARATEAWLHAAGTPPEALAGVANTHYHSDHVGGNHWFQTRYGLPVAASAHDATLVNRRDPAACAAVWLDQPIEPYQVGQVLVPGDVLDTGLVRLEVVAAGGHTRGQVCFYAPTDRVLIAGDALHAHDVPWINRHGEGVHALEQALATLDRLAGLGARLAVSGHGGPIADVAGAIARAQRRYTRWLQDPEALAWHAVKRIFAYALMLRGGIPEAHVAPYLLARGWFQDYSRDPFGTAPEAFVAAFLAEMVRSGAAAWRAGRLVARTPYNPLPPGWAPAATRPAAWPSVGMRAAVQG